MKDLRVFVIAVAAAALMAGCQSTGGSGYAVDVTSYQGAGMGYPEMARELSDGSVQIYPLDMPPAVAVAPGTVHPRMIPGATLGGGRPYTGDSSVVLYPLDGGPAVPHIVPEPMAAPHHEMPVLEQLPPLAQHDLGAPMPVAPISGYVPMTRNMTVAPVPVPEVTSYRASEEPAASAAKVYFNHGSSRVTPAAHQVLDYVAGSKSGTSLAVEGHASERAETLDPVERKIINLKMSMDRAFNVSRELIRKGVPAESIVTKAYGDNIPSYEPGAEDKEAMDRRVEIKSSY